MDLRQLNDPIFLALMGLIFTNAAIGTAAIPQLVDRYLQEPSTPIARDLTIVRARRMLDVAIGLQVVLACTFAEWDNPVLQFALGAYITFDAILALRVMRQAPK